MIEDIDDNWRQKNGYMPGRAGMSDKSLNLIVVFVSVLCGLTILGCAWCVKEGETSFSNLGSEAIVNAVYAAGNDPGLPDQGRVVSVVFNGEVHSRDWYLANLDRIEVVDTVWVSPDLLWQEESVSWVDTEIAKY